MKHHKKKKQRLEIVRTQISEKRLSKTFKCETIDDAMNNFKLECKKQPVYICKSCHRLLWEKSVQKFTIDKYSSINTNPIPAIVNYICIKFFVLHASPETASLPFWSLLLKLELLLSTLAHVQLDTVNNWKN